MLAHLWGGYHHLDIHLSKILQIDLPPGLRPNKTA
jgi:hypothetical protein